MCNNWALKYSFALALCLMFISLKHDLFHEHFWFRHVRTSSIIDLFYNVNNSSPDLTLLVSFFPFLLIKSKIKALVASYNLLNLWVDNES